MVDSAAEEVELVRVSQGFCLEERLHGAEVVGAA